MHLSQPLHRQRGTSIARLFPYAALFLAAVGLAANASWADARCSAKRDCRKVPVSTRALRMAQAAPALTPAARPASNRSLPRVTFKRRPMVSQAASPEEEMAPEDPAAEEPLEGPEEPAEDEFQEEELYPEEEAYVEEEPPQPPTPAPSTVNQLEQRPRPTPLNGRRGFPIVPSTEAPTSPSRERSKRWADAGEGEQGQTVGSEEDIWVDFEDTTLEDVLKTLGPRTGKNFDYDPAVATTKVTVLTNAKIPGGMAYQLIESILASRGFTLVSTLDGNLIKVTPPNTMREKNPLHKGTDQVPFDYSSFQTHIVAIKYADVTELQPILQGLGSEHSRVDAYGPTNTLILTDNIDGLRDMFAFIEEVDVPGYEDVLEVFPLEFTRAEVLATQIQEVLLGAEGTAATSAAARAAAAAQVRRAPTPTRARPTVPGQIQSTVIGRQEQTLRIVPDERLNALIVVASAPLMEQVTDMIDRLDRPMGEEGQNMHIYKLLHADAEMVETALNAIVGIAPRQSAQQAPAQTGEVQPFERKVLITRYEQTNALLIVASPQDYLLLKQLIGKMDVPQRQVQVESVIMRVAINDTYQLQVETSALTGNDFVGVNNIANLATALAAGLESGGFFQGFLSVASPIGGTAAVIDGTTSVTIDGEEMEVPSVPLLLTALDQLTDADVLSKPSLVTVDNQEASIVVGQQVPIVSGTSRSLDTSTSPLAGYTRVERQDVGVKLNVTPQITEGDYIALELTVEVSAIAGTQVGTVDVLGPTIDKSEVQNKVVVKDGATGVIGGLIREDVSRTKNQFPILGDIPVIGWFFRSKSNTRAKQNLVVLVTPHIVKENVDLERVSAKALEDFHEASADILFEKGIIRRIRKRHYMNNKYSPTREYSEKMLRNGQDTFNRGAMN